MCTARVLLEFSNFKLPFLFLQNSTGWCIESGIDPNFETLPISDLCNTLRRFYGSVRKADGTTYSKSSINNIRAAIQRHLQSPPFSRQLNILQDKEFVSANNVFVGNLKRNKRQGCDTTKEYPVISEGDLDQLYSSGVFNTENPDGLQKLVWFSIQFKFCRRGREGQRSLKKEDFVFKVDDVGREYAELKYNDAQKNHQGDSRKNQQSPRMYGTEDEGCPLEALKLYINKLNPKCSAFYQQPRKQKWTVADSVWFNNIPLGINTLGQMMRRISESAGLSTTYTNHSIRATVCTILNDDGNYSDRVICSLTGHRNPQSLKNYCKASSKQKRSMSDALQGSMGRKRRATAPSTVSRPPTSRTPSPAPRMGSPASFDPSAVPQSPAPTLSPPASTDRRMFRPATFGNHLHLPVPPAPTGRMFIRPTGNQLQQFAIAGATVYRNPPAPMPFPSQRPTLTRPEPASMPSFTNCNMANASLHFHFHQ